MWLSTSVLACGCLLFVRAANQEQHVPSDGYFATLAGLARARQSSRLSNWSASRSIARLQAVPALSRGLAAKLAKPLRLRVTHTSASRLPQQHLMCTRFMHKAIGCWPWGRWHQGCCALAHCSRPRSALTARSSKVRLRGFVCLRTELQSRKRLYRLDQSYARGADRARPPKASSKRSCHA